MRRVLIASPAHDGRADVNYTFALVATARLCMRENIDMRELFICGDSIIQNARNDIVKAALENGFDDLIFIDTDQSWRPEWVPTLLNYPVDCVGAAVRKKTDAKELYNVKSDTLNIPVDMKTGLLLVQGLGCGFLRFSRRALQILWDNSEEYCVFGAEKSRWIFDIRPVNGQLVGEDTFVSFKLAQHGIPTYLDAGMTCSHFGTKEYSGDFASWLKRAQAEQSAERRNWNDLQLKADTTVAHSPIVSMDSGT